MLSNWLSPPLLTANLPGIGGRIKTQPEDFVVDEIPAYEPCGSGDHLFLWIEKRDMGAEYFQRQIARRLDVPPGAIGMAGLKDRRAVTRQWVSAPAAAESNLAQLDGDGIHVLQVSRHTNKLKPGHLHGNRFQILIREPDPAAPERLAAILECLRANGLPSFYGSQRFGKDGETACMGFALLKGEAYVAADGSRPNLRGPFLRKLAISAAQSGLFNVYLARRMVDGLFRRVLEGDVMMKWPAGGMFVADDVPREQERFDRRETVSGGPMFGRKTFRAVGPAAEREARVLEAAGLTPAMFRGFGKLLPGTRRHNIVYCDDLTADTTPDGVRLSFTLPAGSYATVLLREVMKAEIVDESV
jgi:tRNA pseudouridine13 synthase